MIVKALSGFYYVDDGETICTCRARGKLRHQSLTPLVGDRVEFTATEEGHGVLDALLPRKNHFQRPAVANIDQMVIIASGAVPVTDPFLIDRMTAIAASKDCESLICINKWDLTQAEQLFSLYQNAGFETLRVSAETGEGMEALAQAIAGKVSAFTGNSGVGKSSILNALEPSFSISVGAVSEKLGRGRHTTRHVELFRLRSGARVADTPGFSSFDLELSDFDAGRTLADCFLDFAPYLDRCRFTGCSHRKEAGCAVLEAVSSGALAEKRHESYLRLYEQIHQRKPWETTK